MNDALNEMQENCLLTDFVGAFPIGHRGSQRSSAESKHAVIDSLRFITIRKSEFAKWSIDVGHDDEFVKVCQCA
jgi:hypothetical protein